MLIQCHLKESVYREHRRIDTYFEFEQLKEILMTFLYFAGVEFQQIIASIASKWDQMSMGSYSIIVKMSTTFEYFRTFFSQHHHTLFCTP